MSVTLTVSHIDQLFAPALQAAKGDLENLTVLNGIKFASKILLPKIQAAYNSNPTVAGKDAASTVPIWETLLSSVMSVLSAFLPAGGILASALPILQEIFTLIPLPS